MPDEAETAELRALRAKAYGPGGGLSAVELARLRVLEGWGAEGEEPRYSAAEPRSSAAEPRSSATEPVEVSETGVPNPSTGSGIGGVAPSVTEPVGVAPSVIEPVEVSGGAGIRRRWLIGAASAALLAIGVGVGWGIWGSRTPSIALTSEQRGWQDELLAEAEYDPGSVVAVSETEGVVIWVATQEAGEQTCVLLSDGDATSTACRPTEKIATEGLWGELSKPLTDGSEMITSTSAMILFTGDGRPAALVRNYQNSAGDGSVYEPEDQAIADMLIELGYGASTLWIAGYYEDVPIWTASPAGGAAQNCLIYAAPDQFSEACGDWEELEDGLTLNIVDGEGADLRAVDVVLESPQSGPHYLTITVQSVRGASEVAVDTDTGEVQLDDKTGN